MLRKCFALETGPNPRIPRIFADKPARHLCRDRVSDSKRCHRGRAFPLTRRLRGHHDFRRVTWG